MSINFIKAREIIKNTKVRLKTINSLKERWKNPDFRKRIKGARVRYWNEYRRKKSMMINRNT